VKELVRKAKFKKELKYRLIKEVSTVMIRTKKRGFLKGQFQRAKQ